MFFESWFGIIRIITISLLIYPMLVFWLRISGKRTLSKWNAFDFVVTIALGSTLSSVIISKDVVYFEGTLALILLIAIQFMITWVSVRYDFLKQIINNQPALLFDNGDFLDDALRNERVTKGEVRAAIRSQGIAALEDVEAVVLETDGTFSVIKKSPGNSRTALADVS